MRYTHTITALLLTACVSGQPFNWQWSRTAASTTNVPEVRGMATDAVGNTYLTGSFEGTATFGTLPPMTTAGSGDVFVAKYNNQGDALWVIRDGGTGEDQALDVAVDAAGHPYITGFFQSATATFGSTRLALQGGMDIFCARLNELDGSFIWTNRFGSGGTSSEQGTALDCDQEGNVYVSGYFKYTLTVPGLATLTGCEAYVNSFLMKLDPDGNGIWSNLLTCSNGYSLGSSAGQALEVDAVGDVYVGFAFRGDSLFIATDTLLNPSETGSTFDGVLA